MNLHGIVRRVGAFWRLRRDEALIASSNLFDPAWYLRTYPSVADSKMSPLRHFHVRGGPQGFDPGPKFDSAAYLRNNPDVASQRLNPLVHFLHHGEREGRDCPVPVAPSSNERLTDVVRDLGPLRIFAAPGATAPRVNLLTDSVSSGSLYGGVGTALMFATLLSQHLGATLRIVTQTQPADPAAVALLLRCNGLACESNIDFTFADRSTDSEIASHDLDLFLTTSWWNTWNALQAVPASRIVYFLQEDERMFYPYGDKHLMCSEVMSANDLRFVINSKLLYEHFVRENFANVVDNSQWFEPAFPEINYYYQPTRPNKKLQFLFYARPTNDRNLFLRGMDAISAAIEQGVLDPALWDITFVGRDLATVRLPAGLRPQLLENLPWPEYAAVVRDTDLGLSLMYTPHPSYPPLDLAASGAVVVTNRYGSKQSLRQYSANILCVDPSVTALVDGLAEGVALAGDTATRRRNYENGGLLRSWHASFAPILNNWGRN